MAFVLEDRVKETTTTTGTGAITLGGADDTFDAFQTYMSNADTTYYAIVTTVSGVDEWEVGIGTWNTGNTLTRTTVLAGSNGSSAVNFTAGSKDVFMTYLADKAVYLDASGNLSVDTDKVTEGSTNLYYTDARVDARLSGGTGVTYTSGEIAIGQAVGTTDNVTFNNVTVDGTLTTDDVTSTNVTASGNVTVTGNLTVNGTTTTVNSNTVNIGDNIMVLNSDETGTPSQDAGIEIERGTATNKTLVWDETNDKWTVGGETFVANTFEGALTGDVTGNVTGNLTGAVTGNADTATALATSRNFSLTGDVTATAVGFDGSGNVALSTSIAAGSIVNADINASAAIVDTKLATISTAGKVSNSATTATDANTASAIVARDASGNFTAGVITATSYSGSGANLTGIAAKATGGGSDEIFWENGQTVTTDYTISTNKNAMTAGDITINSGVTVTVPSGSTWTVI